MTVARTITVGYVAVCTVLAVGLYTFAAITALRHRRWRQQAERAAVVTEADNIAIFAARVRLDSPPMSAMFLAECASNGIESSKDMGL